MKKDATFDSSGQYRYLLSREWNEAPERVVNFVLLNPSTADAENDDPTVESCIQLAKHWKFDALKITNLFAYCSTEPDQLLKVEDPIGAENDHHLSTTAEASDLVVIAWGEKGSFLGRDKAVLDLLKEHDLLCIGHLKDGSPMHPLYKKRDLDTIPFAPKESLRHQILASFRPSCTVFESTVLCSDKELYHAIHFDTENELYYEELAEDWRMSIERIPKETALNHLST